ncbi:MAG: hypothetical protein ACFBZ8_09220 [Opitutales bacterium]
MSQFFYSNAGEFLYLTEFRSLETLEAHLATAFDVEDAYAECRPLGTHIITPEGSAQG